MEKIKTSELFKKLVTNTQLSLISEDDNLIKVMHEIISEADNDNNHWESILKMLTMNTEYLRMVFIKSVCRTLEELEILDSDIDLWDKEVTEDMLYTTVEQVCSAYNDSKKS